MANRKRSEMTEINSEALRSFLKNNSISVVEMSKYCGCDFSTIYKAFSKSVISKSLLTKMLEYFYLKTGIEVRENLFIENSENVDDALRNIAILTLKLKADEKRIETLEAFLRMPWYKRLFYRKEIVNE